MTTSEQFPPDVPPGELEELREAYCIRHGFSSHTPLPEAAAADFQAVAAASGMRRLFFRLTLTGEWICLLHDQFGCRLQRSHLPVPAGWRPA